MLKEPDHIIDLVDDYLHDLLAPVDHTYVEQHCRHCGACAVALAEGRKRFAAIQSLPASEPSERLIRATADRIEADDQQRLRRRRLAIRGALGSIAAGFLLLLGMHLYYSTLTANPYDLVVLGQERLLAGSVGAFRICLTQNNIAVAGVPVTLELRDRAGRKQSLGGFTTDAKGGGSPAVNLPDWPAGEYQLHVVARNGWSTEELTEKVRLERSWRLMLTSDKPVYQPGQLIQVRSLALRRPDLKPVAGESATFTVADPKDNIVFKQVGPTSAYGIASTECALADEIIEGPYTIACKIGDTESRLRVEVKKYVLPKFKVVVGLDQPFYKPGDQINGTIQADYFHHHPVAGGKVEVEMALPGGESRKVEVKTDDAGAAAFGFRLPGRLIGAERDEGKARVQFTAAVTDTAGQKQTVGQSRMVTAEALTIEILPENGTLVTGQTNTVYVMVSTPDGQPARKARLAVTGSKQELTTNDLGVASFPLTPPANQMAVVVSVRATTAKGDTAQKQVEFAANAASRDVFLLRTDKAVYKGGETMHVTILGGGVEPVFIDLIRDGQTVLTQTVEMVKGTGRLDFDIPANLSGTLQLCAYRFGAAGLVVCKTRALYIRSADGVNVKVGLDRKEYRPGKQAKLDVTLTDANGKPTVGAVSLSAVDEAVYSVLEQRPGLEKTFYTLERQLLEPVYAIYPWSPDLGDGGDALELEQALFSRTVRSSVENRPVPVTAPAWQSGGGSVISTAPARIDNGRGAGGPHTLSAATLPAKMQKLEAQRLAGLEMVYWGWTIYGVGIGIGLCGLLVVTAAKQAALAFNEVQSPPPSRGLRSKTWEIIVGVVLLGVIGLTAISFLGQVTNKTFCNVASAIQSTGGPGGGGGGGWSGGGGGGRAAAPAETVRPVPVFKPEPPVVGSVAKEPQPAAPAAEPVRVREWFPETLLWTPQIITDENGHASLKVPLADSITNWKISGSAITADGRLGAVEQDLLVFQPFFVDLNLPVSLTRGDEVAVPAVVYNYLDKPQTVTLTVADAGWFERLGDQGATLELQLAPNEIKAVAIRLRARRVGTFPLEVTARGARGVADALKKEVEVAPDGRKVERVVNGTLQQPVDLSLNLPESAIEGSPKLIVKLYPSSFSQLVEGLDGIFQMPSGCFEQTSSTTYPNILALDYLRRNKKNAPEVEARARQYIHLGYQRLVSFEVPDRDGKPSGGFDWFGRPPANRTLTAYGLMEFQDMARVTDVDPKLIERTRRWLLNAQRNGVWEAEGHEMHDGPAAGRLGTEMARYATTAYIAWAVYGNGDDGSGALTRRYLLAKTPDQIDDPYVLALTCLALRALDPDGGTAAPYLERLDAMKQSKDQGKRVWWAQAVGRQTAFYGAGQSGNVETTALAALALLPSGRYGGTVRGALTWLTEQKDARGTWHSTQATVLALKALLAGTGASLGGAKERRIEVTLGAVKQEFVIPANQEEVVKQIPLSDLVKVGDQRLTVRETTDTGTGYQVVFRYHEAGGAADAAADGPLTIDLAYDRTELAVNDVLKVTATVRNTTAEAAPMVVLDLPVPAGFALNADSLAKFRDAGTIAKFQVTARKAIVYLRGVESGKPLVLPYELQATTPVKVTAAAARAYQYYNPSQEGFSPPRQLTVEARR